MLSGCRDYRNQLIELSRGVASADVRRSVLAHVEVCAECARVFDQQLALSGVLDTMKACSLPEAATIEARVMAEFDRVSAPRVPHWRLVAGIAAAICLGVVLMERRQPVERPRPTIVAQQPVAVVPVPPAQPESLLKRVGHHGNSRRVSDDSRPFVEIPNTVPLSPEERTTIVRMEIPVAALIAIGFNVPGSDPGATVEVDVLVGQDGRARAIRLVSK